MKAFPGHPPLRRSQVHRDLAVLVVLVVGLAVPFLTQPFHMDDNFYMDMARSARAHPLFPYDAPYDFGGLHLPDMASHTHPPLQAYFLALVQHFAGEGSGTEWMYHTAALIFPILAVVSTYFLAALFVDRPLWPAAVLAACPLFLVMGHTLMTDLPMLAFWMASIACFLWAGERNRSVLYAAGALFLCAAMFTSYQAAALIPLLGFWHWRRRGPASGWVALLLPPVLIAGWLAMTSVHYGRFILTDTFGYVQSRSATALNVIAIKALALVEYQGWLILFPLFLIYIFARGLQGRAFGLAVLISVYVAQWAVPGYRLIDKAIFVSGLATGIGLGAAMLALFVNGFVKGRAEKTGFSPLEAQFLALWYFGVAAYCLILFTEGSARYILPLVPPVLIAVFRRLEVTEVTEYRSEAIPLLNSAMVASGSLVLSLAWGMFLAQADFEWARIYSRAAASYARMYDGLDSYVTGEWGFRYYFGRIGARVLPSDESLVRGGSLIVRPTLALPYDPPADLQEMTVPVASLSFAPRTPFRTMDLQTPAGFYSTGWGLIPFSLSSRNLETLQIRQVNFMVERLPWARCEGPSPTKPWPGFVYKPERALAILAPPGSRIIYPWDLQVPAVLTLNLAVVRTANLAADFTAEFKILRRGSRGEILSGEERWLQPGLQEESGKWLLVQMRLPAAGVAGETLEFQYQVKGAGEGFGAFAEAVIRAAGSGNMGNPLDQR